MADGGAQILRQLDGNWLECADQLGIFYFNQVTQQSSDTMPAELAQAAGMMQMPQQQQLLQEQRSQQQLLQPQMSQPQMMPPQPAVQQYQMSQQNYNVQTTKAKVLAGGIPGVAPQPASYVQPASYTPAPAQPASYTPAQVTYQQLSQPNSYAPVMQPATSYAPYVQSSSYQPAQQASYQPYKQASYTPVQQVAQPAAQPYVTAAPQMPAQQPATQKLAFGDWAVYQDEMGMFYMQVSTGMQFEQPPPELMQAYQRYRAEQDQLHLQQLQQIEQQKQMVDQQLYQQTANLQQVYGMAPGAQQFR